MSSTDVSTGSSEPQCQESGGTGTEPGLGDATQGPMDRESWNRVWAQPDLLPTRASL